MMQSNNQQQATSLLKLMELLQTQVQAKNPLQMRPQLSQIVGGHPPPPQIQPDAEMHLEIEQGHVINLQLGNSVFLFYYIILF